MPIPIYALPDNGPTLTAETPKVPNGGDWTDTATSWTGAIPGWIWALTLGALVTATAITFPIARAQARNAGRRTAGTHTAADRRDRALFIASLTPATLFWIAVLAGSARGLIAFARDTLRWTGGWEYLVPATLDGIAVAFGMLAFRAVRKQRNPDRATRIAWAAMAASAAIQFIHEAGLANGSALGGAYLALLSLFGMLIFHEFLDQFEQGADTIKRVNPKFGARWFTWPTNTVCAWFAWRNYPPADGTIATVSVAVQHLEGVRAVKKQRRAERVDAAPWWAPIVPWAWSARLDAALGERCSDLAAERTALAEITALREQDSADHAKALAALMERTEQRVEQARTEAAEQVAKIRAEHAAHVSRIREKAPQSPSAAPGRSSARTAPPPAPVAAPAEPRLSNDEAVELMLSTHPEPGYEWGQREVARLTGAGFSRVPKLIAAVAEHHARTHASTSRSESGDDAEERSA